MDITVPTKSAPEVTQLIVGAIHDDDDMVFSVQKDYQRMI